MKRLNPYQSPPHFPKGLLWSALTLTLFLSMHCSEIISPDISGEAITVNSPADSLYTSDQVISLWWEQNDDIENYNLRITTGPAGNLTLLVDTLMVANNVAYSLEADARYDWQVRGVNEGTETPWVARTFVIDQTSPDKATALNLNGDTLSGAASDTLRWQSLDLPIDGLRFPTTDSLVIFRKNDSTQVGAMLFFDEADSRELPVTASSPSPLNGIGTYWWKVVSFDRAGNRNESGFFKFEVN